MSEETEPDYTARPLEAISNGPGVMNSQKIGVFDGDKQIGEYVRNYSSFYNTFCPFKHGDRWFALYSRHYTGTRIMSLPDCVDLGGEEPAALGFCPVDYLVPKICAVVRTPGDEKPTVANHDAETWAHKAEVEQGGRRWVRYYWPDDKDHPSPDPERREAYLKAKAESHAASRAWRDRHPYIHRHADYAFVAGCVWGDDSGGWKLEFLDLSEAAQGKLVRSARFGYLELPPGVDLKDAVRIHEPEYFDTPHDEIRLTIAEPILYRLSGRKDSGGDA